MNERKPSKLYRHIEQVQSDRPWGSMLDAGTGVNSITWLAGLATDRWTAVTGSAFEADSARDALGGKLRQQDRIILGNWSDPALLKDDVYDTVLADYLLGAIDGFAPYFQAYLFGRLRPLTGRALYVTGLEPYVPTDRPDAKDARLLWEIGRYRDSCILLAGDRPYREFPSQWVIDHLLRAGFKVLSAKHFKILYKERFVNAQIDISVRRMAALEDRMLAKALIDHGEALRTEALDYIAAEGALRSCRNYVIAAEPV